MHDDFFRAGVFEDIGQRLFDYQKDVVPHVRRQRSRRQVVRQVQPATRGVVFE